MDPIEPALNLESVRSPRLDALNVSEEQNFSTPTIALGLGAQLSGSVGQRNLEIIPRGPEVGFCESPSANLFQECRRRVRRPWDRMLFPNRNLALSEDRGGKPDLGVRTATGGTV
jgi:hypothetical protein